MYFLTIKNGKIEIHADISATDAPAAFTTASAYEAARYLQDHGVQEWMNSSSMDFSGDYGWPNDNAAGEIEAHYKLLGA